MKKSYFLIIVGLFLINLAGISLAQEETKTVTTYYPSPQGIYNSLKLFPYQPSSPLACNSDNEGMIFYCDDPVACGANFSQIGLYSCSADTSGDLKWQLIGAVGGYWTFFKEQIDDFTAICYLYTNDSDTAEDWNVGIGTTTPLAKLHITGGGLLASGATGLTPVNPDGSQLGAGTRLMWIPQKAAFRAGGVDGSQWNDANIGEYSFATNYNTIASGQASEAFGNGTIASGNYSIALGKNTVAAGNYSLAAGWRSRVSAAGAGMAVGWSDNPNQWYSNGGISMGKNNFAGYDSWAVGQNVIAGDTSYGHSIAWGYNANAQREYNMAVGLDGTPCTTGLDRYEFKICGDLKVEDVLGTTEGNIQTKSITCTGICTTSSGSKFKIPHPDSSKPKGTSLKHSSIEVPTAGDNLYRWTIDIKNGTAVIQLPDYYKFLNKDDMVWVAAVDNFGRGYGEVDDKQEILTVKADLDGRYNVVLIGTRKDEAAKKYWQGPEEYVEPDK